MYGTIKHLRIVYCVLVYIHHMMCNVINDVRSMIYDMCYALCFKC